MAAVDGDFVVDAGVRGIFCAGNWSRIVKVGRVLKTMRPGDPGTKRWLEKYGRWLVAVRYRGDEKARKRVTTVELIVGEGFWDPEGFRRYKEAFGHVHN